MAEQKHDLAKLFVTQKSLTEWLEDIKHSRAAEIRQDDNDKRERLRVLRDVLGVPFDQPVQFSGQDLHDKSPEVQQYLDEHGHELCALRLIPLDKSLPKLRMRGKTVADAYDWFVEQQVDPAKYRADYVPHSEHTKWATIFVVNDQGIFGEIIRGGHHQLTQGMYEQGQKPYTFSYDFSTWHIEPGDPEAQSALETIVAHLKAPADKQAELREKLGAAFAHDYVKGYFETSEPEEFGLWFIDYSQVMGELLADVTSLPSKGVADSAVHGQIGSKGVAEGEVRIVDATGKDENFPDGAVLVCSVTTPEFVPLMQKCSAIVTDQGGILSHAAIVARELKKPCVVGTQNATQILKDGQPVRVDAETGRVIILTRPSLV